MCTCYTIYIEYEKRLKILYGNQKLLSKKKDEKIKYVWEKFEEAKWVIRSCKSKGRQYNSLRKDVKINKAILIKLKIEQHNKLH